VSATEIARLTAKPGRGDELARQLERSLAVVLADAGCVGARLFRGVEDPDVLVCEIEWLSVEAHHAWRDSPGLAAYRAIIGDLEGAPIEFAHYTLLAHERGAAAKPG
jgi:quinol monooxygenase YgiN